MNLPQIEATPPTANKKTSRRVLAAFSVLAASAIAYTAFGLTYESELEKALKQIDSEEIVDCAADKIDPNDFNDETKFINLEISTAVGDCMNPDALSLINEMGIKNPFLPSHVRTVLEGLVINEFDFYPVVRRK